MHKSQHMCALEILKAQTHVFVLTHVIELSLRLRKGQRINRLHNYRSDSSLTVLAICREQHVNIEERKTSTYTHLYQEAAQSIQLQEA